MEDKGHLTAAFYSIVDRNLSLKGLQELVEDHAPKVRRIFQEIKVPLNNL